MPSQPPPPQVEPLSTVVKERLMSEVDSGTRFAHIHLVAYLKSCDRVIHRGGMGLGLPDWTVVLREADATPAFLHHFALVVKRCDRIYKSKHLGIKKQLHFWLIPSPAKRMWPAAGDPVEPENINGGFTYISLGEGGSADIYLIRREEWPKVAIHEMLHHSKLNIPDSEWTPYIADWYKTFNISMKGCGVGLGVGCQTDIRPNEAIIETWASILHCQALSKELGISLVKLLEAEVSHAVEQATRLVAHQRSLPNGQWSEGTHAWSYLVLRAALMWDIEGFMRITQGGKGKWKYGAKQMAKWSTEALENPGFKAAISNLAKARGSMCMTLLGGF